MRTVPEDLAEHVEYVGWITEKRPQVLEKLASGPDVAEIVVPDIGEANERIRLAVARQDRVAEDEPILCKHLDAISERTGLAYANEN